MNRFLPFLFTASLLLAACQSSSVPKKDGDGNCASLSAGPLIDLVDEYPLDLLSDEIRSDLQESLGGESRVCLVASGTTISCNAGGGPKPDVRRCCRFREEPKARVFGLARRIGLSRGGEQVVDLSVEADLVNASIDRRCTPAVCEDDRIRTTSSISIRGTVRTEEGTVDFDLPVQLDERLSLMCQS